MIGIKNTNSNKRSWLEMSSRNRKAVPEAREALNQFKFEIASEIGVPLKRGYNGDLTSREAGLIGGNMVKRMIEKTERYMMENGRL